MSQKYRIVFESYDTSSKKSLTKMVLCEGEIKPPTDIFDFSHEEQVNLIRSSQDSLLKEQSSLIGSEPEYCPNGLDTKLIKQGKRSLDYHDVWHRQVNELCYNICSNLSR